VESSDVIEIQVQAHIRRIQRPRYHKTCQCPQVPGIVTAPPAPRVIPKSPLGVSVWTMVLLDKYLYGRPTHRLCQELQHHRVPLVCDRYGADKCLAKDHDKLILAYCCAHVRRDFLKAARSWPELESWMFAWVDDIRALYCLNQARLAWWDETVPHDQQSAAFA